MFTALEFSCSSLLVGRSPLRNSTQQSKGPSRIGPLPLAREGKFTELADQRLGGKYNEDELKRVVFVGLICARNLPDKRPTMLEVVELVKGDKEKFDALESVEMFKRGVVADSGAEESFSDEKEHKQEIEDV